MTNQQDDDQYKDDNSDAAVKPDPETLHTTDPQEHMKGPISSLLQGAKKDIENNGSEEEYKEEEKR